VPVGSSSGVAKVTKVAETTAEGTPTATSLTEYTDFKKAIAKSPALISGYQKLLKAAKYYRGPINGKYTPAFQKALDSAEESRLSISAIRPLARDEFLNEQITAGGGEGDGKARTIKQTYIINDSDIEALADKISKIQTGYSIPPKELEKIKNDLRRAQKKNPVVQQYDASGNVMQTGGINEEQFITSRIEQTEAAQTSRATTANEILLGEIGGLR
jgi:hypothetical protein